LQLFQDVSGLPFFPSHPLVGRSSVFDLLSQLYLTGTLKLELIFQVPCCYHVAASIWARAGSKLCTQDEGFFAPMIALFF
jgi:hypothetical protein